jgi:hypothetical protein
MTSKLGAKLLFTAISVGSYLYRDPTEEEKFIYYMVFVLAVVWFDWLWIPAVQRIGDTLSRFLGR